MDSLNVPDAFSHLNVCVLTVLLSISLNELPYYDTSIGCQLLKTYVLDSHPIPVRFLHENSRYCSSHKYFNKITNYQIFIYSTYVVGGSRGGISFFNKSFKLKEKLKVSTNRITSITLATENGKQ